MFASARMSASALWRMPSKVAERWLISITDMPTPGSASRSRCTCSRTGTGSTAGPEEKFRMRVTVGIGDLKKRLKAKGERLTAEDLTGDGRRRRTTAKRRWLYEQKTSLRTAKN